MGGMKKTLFAFVCAVLLSSCSSEPAPLPPLQLDYSSLGKIYLNTQDVRIINRAGATPQKPPYVGHRFQPLLADALIRWGQDRLQAAGTTGHATMIIKEASVKETPLPKMGGIEGWFTREQESKYIGRIEVSLDAQTPVNNATGMASAHSTFAVTLPEDATEAEKNTAYRKLLDELMKDFNQRMESAIRQHMPHFLTAGPSAGYGFAPKPETAGFDAGEWR